LFYKRFAVTGSCRVRSYGDQKVLDSAMDVTGIDTIGFGIL